MLIIRAILLLVIFAPSSLWAAGGGIFIGQKRESASRDGFFPLKGITVGPPLAGAYKKNGITFGQKITPSQGRTLADYMTGGKKSFSRPAPVTAVNTTKPEHAAGTARIADTRRSSDDSDRQPVAPGNSGIVHAWPVAANAPTRISSPFGWRDDPFHGKQAFHAGIDIAGPVGIPVLASADGIAERGAHNRLGKYVRVTHNDGSYSLYGHLGNWNVAQGEAVRQGEKIGEIGSSGRSTGPHLDYSLRINNKPVNPMRFLKKNLPVSTIAADS